MTLYVFEKIRGSDGIPGIATVEASLRDKLTDRGWEECPNRGYHDRPALEKPFLPACPDCVEGLVPPEGMVEAAGRAAFQQRHPDGRWNRQRNFSKKKWCDTQRAALVAAARWEREQ